MNYLFAIAIFVSFVLSIIFGMRRLRFFASTWESSYRVKKIFGATFKQMRRNQNYLKNKTLNIRKVGLIIQNVDNEYDYHRGIPNSVTRYESFVVFNDGKIETLEIGENDQNIEENAQWIASELNVPFEIG